MVIYNKVYEKKDGRKLVASGPRDLQKRQLKNEPSVTPVNGLDELRKDIEKLTSGIASNSSGYAKEQIDEMINSAIEEVSIDLEKQYINEIELLKSENTLFKATTDKLEIKIDKKDEMIIELTTKLSSKPVTIIQGEIQEVVDKDRPSMDNIFIDPAQKGDENKLESHITTKENTILVKADVTSNVGKLKNLMNKLPK